METERDAQKKTTIAAAAMRRVVVKRANAARRLPVAWYP